MAQSIRVDGKVPSANGLLTWRYRLSYCEESMRRLETRKRSLAPFYGGDYECWLKDFERIARGWESAIWGDVNIGFRLARRV